MRFEVMTARVSGDERSSQVSYLLESQIRFRSQYSH